jgi:chemotaxis protein MotA
MILSWIGVLLGVGGIIVGQLLEGGHLVQLIQPTAALIVFGGTLGATLVSSTTHEFSQSIRAVKKIFFRKPPDYVALAQEIITIATVARREGILGLERYLPQIKSTFFSSNLRHIIDGYDPNVVKEMMEDTIDQQEEERMAVAKVWESAGGFSPTIGILGAVLGLIHVMASLSDSSKLGSGIAVAFVATVYGVGAANLLLIPCGNKLKKIGKEEMLEYFMYYEACVGIQSGLNPRVIEDKIKNRMGEIAGELNAGTSKEPAAEKKAA